MISLAAMLGASGERSVVWQLDCDFWDLGRWAVISCGGERWARGEGVLSGLGGCLNWTVVRPLPSVQRMKSATGKFWDLGGWAVISLAASVGRVGMGVLSGLDCDFWDFGRWAVICVVRALGVGMELLSEL